MQCLSSPTRKDIDKAHAQHRWLDIGIPGVRNLGSISRSRRLLWGLLAFSSIPLHLLYNSTVIYTKTTQEYAVFVGSPNLVTGAGVDWSKPVGQFKEYAEYHNLSAIYEAERKPPDLPPLDHFRLVSSWNKMSNEECIQAYGQQSMVGYRDVLAITSPLNATILVLLAWDPVTPILLELITSSTSSALGVQWMWSAIVSEPNCTLKILRAKASAWTLNDTTVTDADDFYSEQYLVDYCLSERVPERCSVQLSLVIMAIVISCNAIKLSCLVMMLRRQKLAPLVTLGDTIESFMLDRDTTTETMCWANKKTFTSQSWEGAAKPWLRQRHFWFASASARRWIICNVFSIATIIAAGGLYRVAYQRLSTVKGSPLWTSGFGTPNPETIAGWSLKGTSGIILTALLVNIPQLLLSSLYLTYNGLYTCMLLADEWSRYAHERKPLRVSKASKSQRSNTYCLSLPYNMAFR